MEKPEIYTRQAAGSRSHETTESAYYTRNIGAVTEDEFHTLQNSRVFIAGCGGLGGHLTAHLVRIGIGHITAIDGDILEPTNMNRQLLCTTETLGQPKAEAARDYAFRINPVIDFTGIHAYLDECNCDSLISGHDVIIDALDNISSRRILASACDRIGIPLVYGAICRWVAQISLLPPGTAARRIEQIYPHSAAITDTSSLSFTPAFCASVQSAEAVKVLLGKPSELDGKLLYADLLHNEWEMLPLL
ncbi:MAG: HesA/MoeB/ThiF family protein [Lachnospiraceae bacterium]|nr:HesA/MoeB/ThiF family protein [Lachnospiraceae bacterium]